MCCCVVWNCSVVEGGCSFSGLISSIRLRL